MPFGGGEKTRFSLSALYTRLTGDFSKAVIDAVVPNNLYSATSLGTPILSQIHALTPHNLVSVTSLGNPILLHLRGCALESTLSIAIPVRL